MSNDSIDILNSYIGEFNIEKLFKYYREDLTFNELLELNKYMNSI